MNILIVGHDTFENRGCQALIVTTTEMLKQQMPDARFKVFSWDPDYDRERFVQNGIPCDFVLHPFNTGEFSRRNRFWLFLNGTLKFRTDKGLRAPQRFFDAVSRADLVVVSGGDVLADYGEAAVKHYFFPVAVASALGKPVYVFAQSISRYPDRGLESFCRRLLDRTGLITVREKISYDYLRELDIRAPFHRTADPAFLLRPCGPGRTKEILGEEGIDGGGEPRIGFSVSRTVTRWGGSDHGGFVDGMAGVLDRLAERYRDVRFLFVPHVSNRRDEENDDRAIGRQIARKVSCRDRVDLVEGDYRCDELKALIGTCGLFVGARTHATIAAVSQGIPTLALAYSIKASGIMGELLDEEVCVLEAGDFSADRLFRMIENLQEHQDRYRDRIRSRLPHVRELASRNGELVGTLV